MMKSEFIERTGFEPTADEYEQIEQEYMGTDIDKDLFCKQWVKNGGIQRLSRMRARRIEELEAEVKQRDKEYTELDQIRVESIIKEQERQKTLKAEISNLQAEIMRLEIKAGEQMNRAEEAERKLMILREAFEILNGKEVEA